MISTCLLLCNVILGDTISLKITYYVENPYAQGYERTSDVSIIKTDAPDAEIGLDIYDTDDGYGGQPQCNYLNGCIFVDWCYPQIISEIGDGDCKYNLLADIRPFGRCNEKYKLALANDAIPNSGHLHRGITFSRTHDTISEPQDSECVIITSTKMYYGWFVNLGYLMNDVQDGQESMRLELLPIENDRPYIEEERKITGWIYVDYICGSWFRVPDGTELPPECYLIADGGFRAFAVLANDWGKPQGKYCADITGQYGIPDGYVDIYDLDAMSNNWLDLPLIKSFKDYAEFANGWEVEYDIFDLQTFAEEWLK